MRKIPLIVGASVSILAMAIVIAIVLYNYYIVDLSKLPQPFDDTSRDRAKPVQDDMIYPTKAGGGRVGLWIQTSHIRTSNLMPMLI